MMKKLNIKERHEQGIALIITLGMLSIMLVLGLAFASNAMIQRKIAANNADMTAAELMAHSGMQRALAMVNWYYEENTGVMPDFRYTVSRHDPDTVNDVTNSTDLFKWDHLPSALDGLVTDWGTVADRPEWQYILGGEDSRILGRVAYLLMSDGAKLNPAACVSHSLDAPGAVYEKNQATNYGRPGIYPYEMDLGYIESDINKLDKFSSTAAGGAGTLSDGTVWNDWPTFKNAAHLDIEADGIRLENYGKWFNVGAGASEKDGEYYWYDNNWDGSDPGDGTETFYRFNMLRADWDALAEGDITAAPTLWDDPADVSTSDGTGIPWIGNFGIKADGSDDETLKGTFSSVENRRKQIIANLIDYCDSDNTPTVHPDWTNPDFTGNEKTPYINEVGIEMLCNSEVEDVAGDGTQIRFNYTIDVYVGCERADMEGYGAMGDAKFRILEGELLYQWIAPDGTENSETVDLSTVGDIDVSSPAPAYYTYGNKILGAVPTMSHSSAIFATPSATTTARLYNVRAKVTKVVLLYDSGAGFAECDFARPSAEFKNLFSSSTVFLCEQSGYGSSNENAYFSFQVYDPRQNLNVGDWMDPVAGVDSSYTNAGGTPDGTNVSPAAEVSATETDVETTDSQARVSTAYIRNSPMQSPWELGFIHRGKKWQTLRLTKSYAGTGYRGGNDYQEGDANLLDQIKMSDSNYMLGKLSINVSSDIPSQRYYILKPLLGGIRHGVPMLSGGNENPGSTTDGTALTGDEIDAMAQAIAQGSFRQRYELADVPALSQAFATDAEKEEVIGKIINLTKTVETAESDYYTLVVVAQTIRDVGGPSSGSGITIQKDINGDGVVGSFAEDGYDFNGDGSTTTGSISEKIEHCKLGQYDQFADEILSEQKIRAELYYNAGKWEVLKYEYIQE